MFNKNAFGNRPRYTMDQVDALRSDTLLPEQGNILSKAKDTEVPLETLETSLSRFLPQKRTFTIAGFKHVTNPITDKVYANLIEVELKSHNCTPFTVGDSEPIGIMTNGPYSNTIANRPGLIENKLHYTQNSLSTPFEDFHFEISGVKGTKTQERILNRVHRILSPIEVVNMTASKATEEVSPNEHRVIEFDGFEYAMTPISRNVKNIIELVNSDDIPSKAECDTWLQLVKQFPRKYVNAFPVNSTKVLDVPTFEGRTADTDERLSPNFTQNAIPDDLFKNLDDVAFSSEQFYTWHGTNVAFKHPSHALVSTVSKEVDIVKGNVDIFRRQPTTPSNALLKDHTSIIIPINGWDEGIFETFGGRNLLVRPKLPRVNQLCYASCYNDPVNVNLMKFLRTVPSHWSDIEANRHLTKTIEKSQLAQADSHSAKVAANYGRGM